MGKKPKITPSTECPRRPFGLIYDTLPPGFLRELPKMFGLPVEPERLRAILTDEGRVSIELAGLSGRALVLLDLLVEADGYVPLEELFDHVRVEQGMDVPQFRAALSELQDAALALEVVISGAGQPQERCIASFDVLEHLLAPGVRGVSVPKAPAIEGPIEMWTRDLVALLGSVAHLPMRVTQHHDVHRGSAKKLAAIASWPADRVIMLIDAAIRDGVLARRGDTLTPVLPKLLALARGDRPLAGGPNERDVIACLPPGRWVSVLGVKRAVATNRLRGWQEAYPRLHASAERRGVIRREAYRAVDTLAVPRVTLGAHDFLLGPGPGSRSGHGDGHVTPSFEVMLGPEADAELVAALALATEPSRFDVVLTRKITRASISAGCAAGLDVGAIVEALGRVGRHGVPDNVRTMVEEWARLTKTARIHDVWALEVSSAEVGDAVARELGADVVARPSPSIVLVERSATNVAARVQKLGVQVLDQLEALSLGDSLGSVDLPSVEHAYLEGSLGNPLLRDRVAENAEPDDGLAEGLTTPFERIDECLSMLSPHAEVAHRFLHLVHRLWDVALSEYGYWAEKLGPQEQEEAASLPLVEPWLLLPWLARAPRKRAHLLGNATSVDALIIAATRLAPRDGVTTSGAEALRLAAHPEVRALVLDARWPVTPSPTHGGAGEPRPAAAATKPSPASTPAHAQPAAAPAKPSNAPTQLGPLDSADHDAVKAAFAKAATEGIRIMLRVRTGSAERLVMVDPERVVERGKDVALLGFDIDDEVDRAFPLATVVAIEPV